MLLNSKKILFIAVVIALTGIAAGVFFFIKYQKAQNIINNPNLATQQEAQDLAKKVARFILLPEGEIPTVATVSDFEKLKDQAFFEKSQNGDKVLIYTQAKKAYLYRPSTDKLIDVTSVNLNSAAEGQSATAVSDLKPQETKIILRNGTLSVGLTNKIELEIKKALPNAVIVNKENAAKSDYQSTIIVVLNENARQAGITLGNYLNATASGLPADENKPSEGDILVIIGKDKAP